MLRLLRLLAPLPALLVLAGPASAATFTVTTAAPSGAGSLTAAITAANTASGADQVAFAIGTAGSLQTITLTTALPLITDAVAIDGRTQGGPGYTGPPLVRVTGVPTGTAGAGVHLAAGAAGSTVRGLAITRFNDTGVVVRAAAATIADSYVGVALNGEQPGVGNARGGVVVEADGALLRDNVIGDNQDRCGVAIVAAAGTVLRGNRIGTNAAGTGGLGNNATCGVLVEPGAVDTLIGGTGAGDANVISGNDTNGVEIRGGTGTRVQGNRIGVGPDAAVVVANTQAGILVTGGTPLIGGVTAAAGNVISGNNGGGVRLTAPADLQGNIVGLAGDGVTIKDNEPFGVKVESGTGARIGGPAGPTGAAPGNVISGQTGPGVWLTGAAVRDTVVAGNVIGLGTDGSAQRNTQEGVLLAGTGGGNLVGGRTTAERNVISGNTGAGVRLAGGADRVEGNRIGTDAAGTASRGNAVGVRITGASAAVGGTAAGAGNLVSGNDGAGVVVAGGAAGAMVLGNQIGGGPGGDPTVSANQGRQVSVEAGASGTTIGGVGPGAGNRIVEVNAASGAIAVSVAADGTRVRGNVVRLNANGLAIDIGDAGPGPAEAPALSGALVSGTRTQVSGTAQAPVGSVVDVDVHAAGGCTAARRGLDRLLGSGTATAGADGIARFNFPVEGTKGADEALVVVATPGGGSSSEPSACRTDVGAAPTLQLTGTQYVAGERDGVLRITLERTGGGDGSASVRLRTVDGTARAGAQYTAVDRTVQFNAAQTAATVEIQIADDGAETADRTFDVVLSDPVAAVVGVRDRGTATIVNVPRPPVTAGPPPGGGTPPPSGSPIIRPIGPVALSATLISPQRAIRSRSLRTIRGTARGTGLTRVEVAVTRTGGCGRLASTGRLVRGPRACPPRFLRATGTTTWRLALKRLLPAGTYRVRVRPVGSGGRRGAEVRRTVRVR